MRIAAGILVASCLGACASPAAHDAAPIVIAAAPPPTASAKITVDPDAGPDSAALAAEATADELLQNKLDEYIKCINRMSSSLMTSHRTYAKAIPTKTGPTPKTVAPTYDLLPRDAASSCESTLAASKKLPPPLADLESAGDVYTTSAKAYDALLAEAKPYLDNREWKRDAWKKGKALHARLVAAYAVFSPADKRLHDVLDGITRPLAQRTLARLGRDDGMRFRYHRKRVLITARTLVETGDPAGDDEEVDVTALDRAATTFVTAVEDLVAYGDAHRADLDDASLSPSAPAAATSYDAFVREARVSAAAAQRFLGCLRSAGAARVDPITMTTCADGTGIELQDAAIHAYNKFIRTSNTNPFP